MRDHEAVRKLGIMLALGLATAACGSNGSDSVDAGGLADDPAASVAESAPATSGSSPTPAPDEPVAAPTPWVLPRDLTATVSQLNDVVGQSPPEVPTRCQVALSADDITPPADVEESSTESLLAEMRQGFAELIVVDYALTEGRARQVVAAGSRALAIDWPGADVCADVLDLVEDPTEVIWVSAADSMQVFHEMQELPRYVVDRIFRSIMDEGSAAFHNVVTRDHVVYAELVGGQVDLAARVVELLGPMTQVTVGGLPYPPASSGFDECVDLEPDPAAPRVDVAVLEVVVARFSGEVVMRVTNTSSQTLVIGRERVANLTTPGGERTVSRYAGNLPLADGSPSPVEPGDSVDLRAQIGLDPCAFSGDYNLAPVTYEVAATVVVTNVERAFNETVVVRAPYQIG